MRHTTVSNALRRTAALVLAAALATPTAFAAAGERKIQTSSTLVDGLTYRNTVTVNNSSRVESFSMELTPDSTAYPILLQGSGTMYGAATINHVVSIAQEQGYHVLGAINTDFFSTASGVPIGISIEDGVYKSSPENESAMLITDGAVTLCQSPKIDLTLTNGRDGGVTSVHHLNKWRSSTGGLYLLNRDFSTVSTRTSTSGWYVRMKLVSQTDPNDPLGIWAPSTGVEEPVLTVNSSLTLEVTELVQSDQPLTIGEDEYILTSDDASGYSAVYHSFQVGDQVTLTTSCQDEALSAAQWAGGVGDIMIRDGQITDTSSWTYMKDGRAPRTALGVKEDGTLLLYAVDGRQSGYSMGLSQLDLAQEMLAQGCRWAVNLDGGGSTAISIWLPGQSAPTIKNIPSDGTPRSCATYLLWVTDDAGDGTPDRLALTEDGAVVLAGSSLTLPNTVVLDSGLNTLNQVFSDLTVTSQNQLGTVENGVYTAGTTSGTDTLLLSSEELGVEGTGQVHVVNALSSLTISKSGSSTPLTALSVKAGESVQLSVTGTYWGRTALRDFGSVTWTVNGDVGSVDENGLFTASETLGSGSLTATAGGLSQTIQIASPYTHTDVSADHWSYPAVEYCYQQGIVGGISSTEFGRDYSIRRADFMLMLYNAVGQPEVTSGCTFADVSPTDYYYTALSWAQEAGLASGTGDGLYNPTSNVTREQAFTILRQVMPLLGADCPDAGLTMLAAFDDRGQIAEYARGYTATLVAQGVVSGKGTGIDPKGNLTRAEMAALLYKMITYTPIQEVPADQYGTVVGADRGLNVRSGPGTDNPVAGSLPNGSEVVVLDYADGWYQIFFSTEQNPLAIGYVSEAYLQLSE
jgi:exopolysaccharide biosynthesis protein